MAYGFFVYSGTAYSFISFKPAAVAGGLPAGLNPIFSERTSPGIGKPEQWKGFFDLAQLYAQKPIGRAQLSLDAPPVVRGTPEPWKGFFDLSQVYAQKPVGRSQLSLDVPPPVRPGVPESWKGFLDLSQIYAQKPVGARQLSFDSTPIVRLGQPERWKGFFDLALITTPPSQPPGARLLSFDAPPVVRGQPERWKGFFDLSQLYSQQPVGTVLLFDAPPVVRGHPEWLPPDLLSTLLIIPALNPIFRGPIFTQFPAALLRPPAQFVPPNLVLASVYSQLPVGATQLSFTAPPVVRGNPELWETILSNQLPQIYAQQPTGASSLGFFNFPPPIVRASAEWLTPDLLATLLTATPPTIPFVYYDFSSHPAFGVPAQQPLFPNVVLSFGPSTHKAIEWILRARRRHNR